MYYWDGMGGWGYVLMAVGMLAFLALVVVAGIALFRLASGGERRPPGGPGAETGPGAGPGRGSAPGGEAGAEETLARRYARGEIDEAEYRRRLDVLRGAH